MNPQSLNPYVYCMNNPMKYIDLDGLKPIDWPEEIPYRGPSEDYSEEIEELYEKEIEKQKKEKNKFPLSRYRIDPDPEGRKEHIHYRWGAFAKEEITYETNISYRISFDPFTPSLGKYPFPFSGMIVKQEWKVKKYYYHKYEVYERSDMIIITYLGYRVKREERRFIDEWPWLPGRDDIFRKYKA